ncbi:uncharacterized protein JN550_003058 [Neoarthrinium moseri]|uniref:uncharacterized protein n=1 Tax=Neoarthrinium moseri TaxID=1658444 RepID=UPI001FDD5381|nr:uncharacterized protein JN550_003058 [Neoarthrinium moseri]KAI1873789.1 hypothetical protein JN550_003058 [Neoarthrinium moseri]
MSGQPAAFAEPPLAEASTVDSRNPISPRHRRVHTSLETDSAHNDAETINLTKSQPPSVSAKSATTHSGDKMAEIKNVSHPFDVHGVIVPDIIQRDHFGPLHFGPVRGPFVFLQLLAQVMMGVWPMLAFITVPFMAFAMALVYAQGVTLLLAYARLHASILRGYAHRVFGPLRFLFVLGLFTMMGSVTMAWYLVFTTFYWLGLANCCTAIYWICWLWIRHNAIKIGRPEFDDIVVSSIKAARLVREKLSFDAASLVLFAGSGGHTREMINIMESYAPWDKSTYRLWLISEGDAYSRSEIQRFEDRRAALKRRQGVFPGPFIIHEIARARYVHQSFLTSPFTALLSAFDAYGALTRGLPFTLRESPLYFPEVICLNGPGSALVLALVSHILKLVGVIPVDRCRVIYVETFTRVRALSMTGKIMYHLGLADAFIVQHTDLIKKYGLHCEVLFTARQAAITATEN